MEGQLAVHLPGTDPEEPAKPLTDRAILNMNKKKKKKRQNRHLSNNHKTF